MRAFTVGPSGSALAFVKSSSGRALCFRVVLWNVPYVGEVTGILAGRRGRGSAYSISDVYVTRFSVSSTAKLGHD